MYPLSRVPGSVHIVNMTGHHRYRGHVGGDIGTLGHGGAENILGPGRCRQTSCCAETLGNVHE